MTRLLVAAAGFWRVWWPFPTLGANPVAGLIALHSPRLHGVIRAWHYLAPAVAAGIAWSIALAVGRAWLPGLGRRRVAGTLPPWPVDAADPAPAVVVGELHHPVADHEVA